MAAGVASAPAGRAAATFHDMPPGRYAVAAFQDGNDNERLDTNLFGILSEPYGLSNDASAFDAAAIVLDGDGRTVTIMLH